MIQSVSKDEHGGIIILLANSLPIARRGIMLTLESLGFVVKWVTSSGVEAEKISKEFSPDLVVLDIDLHDQCGLEVIRRRRLDGDMAGFIILANPDQESRISEAIQSGANAFVLNNCKVEELQRAIISASYNEKYVCSRQQSVSLTVPA